MRDPPAESGDAKGDKWTGRGLEERGEEGARAGQARRRCPKAVLR